MRTWIDYQNDMAKRKELCYWLGDAMEWINIEYNPNWTHEGHKAREELFRIGLLIERAELRNGR